MICTLSFESNCKHCKSLTCFTALSIPDGLPEEHIIGILNDREADCCYTCYQLVELPAAEKAALQKKEVDKKIKFRR